MYGIGTVARLAQVSVRTLRYYDELGLLRPVWTDPETGHRWYSSDQLPRLHRILALRDLGVALADIGRLLDDGVSAEELRGILLLRRAEASERMEAEAERLTRVEARLEQLKERDMADYDVVVKGVEAVWAAVLPSRWRVSRRSRPPSGASVAPHPRGHGGPGDRAGGAVGCHRDPHDDPARPIQLTTAVPIPEGTVIDEDGITTAHDSGAGTGRSDRHHR